MARNLRAFETVAWVYIIKHIKSLRNVLLAYEMRYGAYTITSCVDLHAVRYELSQWNIGSLSIAS